MWVCGRLSCHSRLVWRGRMGGAGNLGEGHRTNSRAQSRMRRARELRAVDYEGSRGGCRRRRQQRRRRARRREGWGHNAESWERGE